MKICLLASIATLGVLLSPTTAATQTGDAAAGKDVFRKCMACHRIGPDAKNAVGPVMNDVIGRQAGTIPGFGYSELNQSAGKAGLVWTEELIFDYLADPSAFLKKFLTEKGQADKATGATRMVFKLADETDRRNVIAYIKQFSPEAKK
jgi:cytochrome c